MVTVPFEETLNPVIWEEIDGATHRSKTPEYRIHPIRQSALLSAGMGPRGRPLRGGQVGGKYLRAPTSTGLSWKRAGASWCAWGTLRTCDVGSSSGPTSSSPR